MWGDFTLRPLFSASGYRRYYYYYIDQTRVSNHSQVITVINVYTLSGGGGGDDGFVWSDDGDAASYVHEETTTVKRIGRKVVKTKKNIAKQKNKRETDKRQTSKCVGIAHARAHTLYARYYRDETCDRARKGVVGGRDERTGGGWGLKNQCSPSTPPCLKTSARTLPTATRARSVRKLHETRVRVGSHRYTWSLRPGVTRCGYPVAPQPNHRLVMQCARVVLSLTGDDNEYKVCSKNNRNFISTINYVTHIISFTTFSPSKQHAAVSPFSKNL